MDKGTQTHGLGRVLDEEHLVASEGEVVILELDRMIHQLRQHAVEHGRTLDWRTLRMELAPTVTDEPWPVVGGGLTLRVRILSEGVE